MEEIKNKIIQAQIEEILKKNYPYQLIITARTEILQLISDNYEPKKKEVEELLPPDRFCEKCENYLMPSEVSTCEECCSIDKN